MGRFEFQGYSFDTAKDMDLAKREAESVEYIKAKMERKDRDKTRKLYDSLVEKQSFITPVGIQFMKELQQDLSMFSTSSLQGVPVHLAVDKENQIKGKLTKEFIAGSKDRNVQQVDIYKNKLKNSRIIITFLVVLILAMFSVVLFGKNSPLQDAEEKLQDKYATWEEQLKEKEQLLLDKEEQLNSMD